MKTENQAPTPPTHTKESRPVRAYGLGVLVVTALYTVGMLLLMRFDRTACRPETLAENVLVEMYDWIVFPTMVFGSLIGHTNRYGGIVAIMLAGALWGVFLAVCVAVIRTTRGPR